MLDSVLIWADKNRGRWLEDLRQWLAIPSVSTQQSHDADVAAAAEWAMLSLRGIGLTAELISTPRHPCVFATTPASLCPAHAPHILFYGHYDVQPAQIEDGWHTPPFKPTVKNGDLIARGSSDDKGQVHAHLAALLAWREIASELPVRLTVLLEGEEEIGSINLPTVMEQRRDQLKSAQALIISDCNQFAPGLPALTCGLRGLMYYQMEVQGPAADLHSGLFGGAVANPANALVEMLARMHDGQGRVTLSGFYDDVADVEEALRRQWRSLPFTDDQFAREAGIKTPFGETGYTTLERKWIRPTLDINGLWSGYQGPGAKTVLPARASAKLSMRLVPNQNPQKIATAFEAFIQQITPPGVAVT
ncbi:MAG: M20/M25/M40 family metallo-hydrolase, partial [Phycisphaerae bacterium]|nr:M20/M25/M40 family metallo-hydrolase [Phycisphaerae bacterium]